MEFDGDSIFLIAAKILLHPPPPDSHLDRVSVKVVEINTLTNMRVFGLFVCFFERMTSN